MKEDAYAASGILGKLLCTIGAHRYCNHPRIESVLSADREVHYCCPECEQEFDFNGEKFVPLSETKYCLRCGHIRVDKPRDKK